MERETAKKRPAAHGSLSRLPKPARNAALERSVLKKELARGEPIDSLEDPPGGMNGLVSGTNAISIAAGNRPLYFIYCGRRGFWPGETAVITGEPRQVGVLARSDAKVLHVSPSALNGRIAASSALSRHLAPNAAVKLDIAFVVLERRNKRGMAERKGFILPSAIVRRCPGNRDRSLRLPGLSVAAVRLCPLLSA